MFALDILLVTSKMIGLVFSGMNGRLIQFGTGQ